MKRAARCARPVTATPRIAKSRAAPDHAVAASSLSFPGATSGLRQPELFGFFGGEPIKTLQKSLGKPRTVCHGKRKGFFFHGT